MSLGSIISRLRREDQQRVVPLGFKNPHSYRGYYEDLAFEPAENVAVAEMLKAAESAVGQTFEGYKGGTFKMNEHTRCWLAYCGACSDDTLGPALLDAMLAARAGGAK